MCLPIYMWMLNNDIYRVVCNTYGLCLCLCECVLVYVRLCVCVLACRYTIQYFNLDGMY